MTNFEKILCGIGVFGAAVGAAWGVYELSKKHPNVAKFTIGVANEVGNVAADKISNYNPEDKPVVEVAKSIKDVLADEAKQQIDSSYQYHNQRWLP